MRGLIETARDLIDALPVLEGVVVVPASVTLSEGKKIDGRFSRNIRIDQPTHLGGEGLVHAHVYGRHGDQVVVVNIDGTGSHGTKGKLSYEDAEALRARNFKIRPDRVVEWTAIDTPWELLTEHAV